MEGYFFKFMIFGIAAFSLTTFLSIPILRRINDYKEKILLLVSRINLTECEFELNRLGKCLIILKNEEE